MKTTEVLWRFTTSKYDYKIKIRSAGMQENTRAHERMGAGEQLGLDAGSPVWQKSAMANSLVKRNSRLFRLFAYTLGGAILGAVWARYLVRDGGTPHVHSWRAFLFERAQAGFPPGILLSLVMLCLFSVYWEVAARNAAETKSRETRGSRTIHVALLTGGQLFLLFPVPGLRFRFMPYLTWVVVASLFLEFAFLALAVWARRLLGRNWSDAVAIKVDQQLIRSGPYRFVRHPIYSAMLGAYVSIALVSGEIHALVGLVLVCIAYWRKIRIEEQTLMNLFGPAYSEYCASVSAVIPGVL